jgi:hypothetical protein
MEVNMILLGCLAVVFACLVLAGIAISRLDAENWERRTLDIVIGASATFAGVFLGLGLDDVRKDLEDRRSAVAVLHTAIVGFTEEMRQWRQDAQHFPAFAMKTSDPEQRRLIYENFDSYLSQADLSVPHVIDELLKNDRAAKSFNELLYVRLTDDNIRVKNASEDLHNTKLTIGQRYAAYQGVLQMSTRVIEEMCMQSDYLSGELEAAVFDKFTRGELNQDEIIELGCEPGWDVNFVIKEIFRQAGAAGRDNQPIDVNTGP